MRKQHQENFFFSKVARTWILLFSVPLYIGSTVLWMKEEIKQVLAQESAPQQLMMSLKKQVKDNIPPANMQAKSIHHTYYLP